MKIMKNQYFMILAGLASLPIILGSCSSSDSMCEEGPSPKEIKEAFEASANDPVEVSASTLRWDAFPHNQKLVKDKEFKRLSDLFSCYGRPSGIATQGSETYAVWLYHYSEGISYIESSTLVARLVKDSVKDVFLSSSRVPGANGAKTEAKEEGSSTLRSKVVNFKVQAPGTDAFSVAYQTALATFADRAGRGKRRNAMRRLFSR